MRGRTEVGTGSVDLGLIENTRKGRLHVPQILEDYWTVLLLPFIFLLDSFEFCQRTSPMV